MRYCKHIISAAAVLLLALALPASAQRADGWKVTGHGEFFEARNCNPEVNCVILACQKTKGREGLIWRMWVRHYSEPDIEARIAWRLDGGTIVFPMYLNGSSENNYWGYDIDFNPDYPPSNWKGPTLAQSHALLQALRRESSVTVDGSLFPTFNLSLRGSNKAITQLLAECPFAGEADAAAVKAAVLAWDAPFEAVDALAAKQGCIISESEIFDTMMQAGADAWSVNQFVVNGSQNGTLKPLGETDDEYRYRLAGCVAQ